MDKFARIAQIAPKPAGIEAKPRLASVQFVRDNVVNADRRRFAPIRALGVN